MKFSSKAYIQMNIATFLWGLTAILGKVISISEFSLVWYRVFMVTVSMLLLPKMIQHVKKIDKKTFLIISAIGILLALHWIAWYGSIKHSNASIAVSCIAIVSLFVALLEPIILKTKFDKLNLILGISVIPGILLINQSLDIHYRKGLLLGILAAFLAALFNIYNKKYTQEIAPNTITFVQMLSAWLFMSLLLPFYIKFNPGAFHLPNVQDFFYLIILSVFCTAIPYNLFLYALKASDAFTTSLINNLEPIYGIILAAILLGENEELTWQFYLGSFIILVAVFMHAAISHHKNNKKLR
ncbi:MAG: DMT family transporter [Chitinophagales bacterium]|nr:DMT family transporter [Chitinophagales bacterium]